MCNPRHSTHQYVHPNTQLWYNMHICSVVQPAQRKKSNIAAIVDSGARDTPASTPLLHELQVWIIITTHEKLQILKIKHLWCHVSVTVWGLFGPKHNVYETRNNSKRQLKLLHLINITTDCHSSETHTNALFDGKLSVAPGFANVQSVNLLT